MSLVRLAKTTPSQIKNPPNGMLSLFFDVDNKLKFKDAFGNVFPVGSDVSVIINEETSKLTQNYDLFSLNASNNQRQFNEKVVFFLDALIGNVPHPTYVPPVLSITNPTSTLLEVGTNVTVNLSSTFTQNDAGSIVSRGFTRNGTNVSSTASMSNVINPVEQTTYNYQAFVNHAEGVTKDNSLGIPDPVGKITAGTINSVIRTVTGVYPVFYGFIEPDQNISHVQVSNLTKAVIVSTGTVGVTFNGVVGKRLVVAIPIMSTAKTKWWVNALNNGNIGNPGDLFSVESKIFNSPNSFWSNINYRVYISSTTNMNGVMELRN